MRDNDLRNKKVVVVGLGTSGVDMCSLLSELGAIVFCTESADNEAIRENARKLENRYIEIEIGAHTENFLKGCNLVCVSPGVSKDALPFKYALMNDIPLIGEIELGFTYCKAPIVAITGTNGKSTVTSLVGDLLKDGGKKVRVCGNIGNSLSGEVTRVTKDMICVVEVSSFQLEWIVDFRPAVSCILNITDNHLERYNDFDDYAMTKLKIFSNQIEGDIAVLNFDDKYLKKLPKPSRFKKIFYSRVEEIEGIFFKDGEVFYRDKNAANKIFKMPPTKLKGNHNIENILASIIIAMTQGIEPSSIEATLRKFKPLSHRIESLGEINGIEFLDDSKATSIDATKRVLETMDLQSVILIAGGRDKGGNYDAIKEEIKSKVKKLILVGEAAPIIEKYFKGLIEIEKADNLEEAARGALKSAKKGEKVLLSPMCSSFDMFRDYKHRGDVFRQAFEGLKSKS